jgi:hypothetical protein
VPHRFLAAAGEGLRKEQAREIYDAVNAILGTRPSAQTLDDHEVDRYHALCERAWLRWTRAALDHVTMSGIQQASVGPFNPPQVRNADDARRAETRCALHGEVLELAARGRSDADWTWELEAARQVHACTEKALSVAARLDPHAHPTVHELSSGIGSAADALVAAVTAGFVEDAAGEVRRTVAVMEGIGR